MKLNRFIFGLIVLTLIFQTPRGPQAKIQTFRAALGPSGLTSNCQKLLYLPEAPRSSILHRLLN